MRFMLAADVSDGRGNFAVQLYLLYAVPLLLVVVIELAFGRAVGPRWEVARRKDGGSGYWFLIALHLFLAIFPPAFVWYVSSKY